MTTQFDDFKRTCREILDDLPKEYERMLDADHQRQIDATAPGDPMPKRGNLSEAGKDQRRGIVSASRQAIREAAQKVIDAQDLTAAPSPEAAATLAVLNTREHVTKRELGDLFKKYGSNYQVHQALSDIARRHNVNPPASSIQGELDAIEEASGAFEGLFKKISWGEVGGRDFSLKSQVSIARETVEDAFASGEGRELSGMGGFSSGVYTSVIDQR